MTIANVKQSIASDLQEVLLACHYADSLLFGALSVIDEPSETDPVIFEARQIIEVAREKLRQAYISVDDRHLLNRIMVLEGAEQ